MAECPNCCPCCQRASELEAALEKAETAGKLAFENGWMDGERAYAKRQRRRAAAKGESR